jgi:hypothetical protein
MALTQPGAIIVGVGMMMYIDHHYLYRCGNAHSDHQSGGGCED